MRSLFGIILLAATVASAQATKPATTTASNAAEIQALVKQLSADSYQDRQEAQDKLVRFGEEATPFLDKLLTDTTDAEARTRAESAIQQIADNKTTGPSIITLHVNNAPAEVVLQDLARQAFTTLPPYPDNLFKMPGRTWPPVTLDIDKQPFWQALRTYCEKTGLRPGSFGGGQNQKLVMMQTGDESFMGPASYSGPFMVVANHVTRSATVQLSRGNAIQRYLNIGFTVFAEPKLSIVGRDYQCRLSEAVDENGNSLVLEGARVYNSMSGDASSRWNVQAQLAQPEGMGTKIARLKGSVRAMVQTKVETWSVPQITTAANAAKVMSGRRYSIDEVKRESPERYTVKLTATRNGAAAGGAEAQWNRFGRGPKVTLQDADGQALSMRGYNGNTSDDKSTYTYTFDRNDDRAIRVGEPAKLVLEVPTEVKDIEIPFEFRDVPLP